jgi:hypothetical protein
VVVIVVVVAMAAAVDVGMRLNDEAEFQELRDKVGGRARAAAHKAQVSGGDYIKLGHSTFLLVYRARAVNRPERRASQR